MKPAGESTAEHAAMATSDGPFDAEMKQAGQLTSPTWELELFLSGAFVFATFQLPGLIESVFSRLEPHATGTSTFVLFTGSLYAKAIAFTLIGMFTIHLVTRAYWVALMGLHSVYPRGIRWDELKVGPISRRLYQAHTPDISRAIARLDNFCSIVFSVGLMIVLIFVYSTLLAGVIGGFAYLLANGLGRGSQMRYFFYALGAVFVGIPTVSNLWDKRAGERYAPDSRAYRVLRGFIRVAFTLNLMRFTGPMMWTLVTNVGRRKAIVVAYVILMGLILLSAADRLFQSDRLSANTYDFFGASRNRGVDYRYYENQREAGKPYSRTPSIQSDVIRDPYVKLFIPYYPRRHNVVMARECPGLKPVQERGVQIGPDVYVPDSLAVPALDCIAKIHAVTLDGVPRPDLEFAFYEQPASGVKGVIAYIPADSLARGRHVIGVLPMPPEKLPADTAALREQAWKKQPMLIPFWR